jgi:hypothetical protein
MRAIANRHRKNVKTMYRVNTAARTRSYLKKVFSPDIGVDASFQIIAIREYACGLKPGLALMSNEKPDFEMASN